MKELLNEEEGSTLDFKRDQYPFEKATARREIKTPPNLQELAGQLR
jgi:hypothetical protein